MDVESLQFSLIFCSFDFIFAILIFFYCFSRISSFIVILFAILIFLFDFVATLILCMIFEIAIIETNIYSSSLTSSSAGRGNTCLLKALGCSNTIYQLCQNLNILIKHCQRHYRPRLVGYVWFVGLAWMVWFGRFCFRVLFGRFGLAGFIGFALQVW